MTAVLELIAVNRYLLAKQHLTPTSLGDDVVQVTRDVGGLHATSATTPYLSLFARMRAFVKADLEWALYEQHSLAKLRCVRRTIYLHPRNLLPMVHAATSALSTRDAERYLRLQGIDPDEFARLREAIIACLQGRSMTATAIRRALGTQADVSSVLSVLGDQGVVARARPEGGWRDSSHAYALWTDLYPDADLHTLDQAEATRQLVAHYLACFGPATEDDIVWWTGLGQRAIRVALQSLGELVDRLAIAGLEGEFLVLRADLPALLHPSSADARSIALLPVLDPYMMGFKQRARYLDDRITDYIFDRSGNATSTILVDGRVAGVWDCAGVASRLVKYLLFEPVDADVRALIVAQAARLGQFIYDEAVDVVACERMTPLTERTAGGMLSPLKGCQAQLS